MREAVVVSLVFTATVLVAGRAGAVVDIVATTSSVGMLARTVGGDAVKVTVLALPDRDAHFLQAKPSMMLAVRRAKLLVAVGAELEVGWLPAVIEGAGNPRVLPGQSGYFEAAAQVDLIEKGGVADRSKGDVHPMGNPHLYLDPPRMALVARALATRLGTLDPPHAAHFVANAEAFQRAVGARLPRWSAKAAGAAGVVLYHKDVNYLARLLGLTVHGYLEPLPGIQPTAQSLRDLVAGLRGKRGVVVYADFQPSQGPAFLERELGWQRTQLPLEPGLTATGEDYLALVDRWVDALTAVKR